MFLIGSVLTDTADTKVQAAPVPNAAKKPNKMSYGLPKTVPKVMLSGLILICIFNIGRNLQKHRKETLPKHFPSKALVSCLHAKNIGNWIFAARTFIHGDNRGWKWLVKPGFPVVKLWSIAKHGTLICLELKAEILVSRIKFRGMIRIKLKIEPENYFLITHGKKRSIHTPYQMKKTTATRI